MTDSNITEQFFEQVGRTWTADELFDSVGDVVFFLKDREGRYVLVNQTLVTRCSRKTKSDLIGKTAQDVFPHPLGESFSEQDFDVIKGERSIREQLELHLYPDHSEGWCLTWKEPVRSLTGEIVGVSGISRDLPTRSESQSEFSQISEVLSFIDENLHNTLPVTMLAERAGLSVYQLDHRIRSIFGVSAGQYITRRRIDRARHLLRNCDKPISVIALDCGYADQSAFTRQFRHSVGITPSAYRDR